MDKNKKTLVTVLSMVIGMFCLSYAAFPLYNLFCKVTGYGGTTGVSENAPVAAGEHIFKVRFNADISPDLNWEFKPEQTDVTIRSGTQTLVFYEAKNLSNKPLTGVATYNVTPDKAGEYFQKIACFCFENQTLQPGETVSMPISFYIDPTIESDKNTEEVRTITLSYSFFPAE